MQRPKPSLGAPNIDFIGYSGVIASGITMNDNNTLTVTNAFAQNVSIPSNVITTPNRSWVTPLQTQENGNNLTIHYEKGIDVTGKIAPTGPPPLLENQNSQPVTTWWDRNFTFILYGITAVAIVAVFLILRRKDESSSDFK